MAVSAKLVKELRERTGLGMMECKKALAESGGDVDKAIEDLRKSSGLKAAKKAGRTAADGVVVVRVADDNSYGVIVEVNSETDVVAHIFPRPTADPVAAKIKVHFPIHAP